MPSLRGACAEAIQFRQSEFLILTSSDRKLEVLHPLHTIAHYLHNSSMSDLAGYRILGRINDPADLRGLQDSDLPLLAAEMRRYLLETLSRIGGHFAANLGTVELAIALHRCLNTPDDRLIWDIGHQAYPHKMLTGRRQRLETERRLDGLAPFLSRTESRYDAFGAGHAGTSLSAAAGMAAAFRLQGQAQRVVAVIGDGGLTSGMAFEALNHIGAAGLDVLVILNDNGMSISENVGALRDLAARGRFSTGSTTVADMPAGASLQQWFAALGFHYEGPVDGHDLGQLRGSLESLLNQCGPRVLHALTVKGKGYAAAEADPIAWHGVPRFDPVTALFVASKNNRPSYSKIFGDWLCATAGQRPDVVAITPAMREGSGLVEFAQRFPERYFDVGIAEQHAVTLAAGLACEGLRPVLAIYSTFLQRGYDQVVHDIAIQNLPVLFAIDRGGLVGADGATHHGAFDLALLRSIPNLTVMVPSDGEECTRMLDAALALPGPAAVRYPRGTAATACRSDTAALAIGRGRVLRESSHRRRPRVGILSFGALLAQALEAAEVLDADVADMRFVKPIDEALLRDFAQRNQLLVTLEDHALAGGAGSAVAEVLCQLPRSCPILMLGLPDHFIEHGSREELLSACGLDSTGIVHTVRKRLRALEAGDSAQTTA